MAKSFAFLLIEEDTTSSIFIGEGDDKINTNLKKCSRCQEYKILDCFSKNKSRKDGKSTYCISCAKIMREERKNNNVRNYLIDLIRTSKGTSEKRKNINIYNIDVDYLEEMYNLQNGKCAISNIIMTHISGQGKKATNISIDRIDNSKGYEKGNIQLVCYSINLMKTTMTTEEMEYFLNELVIYRYNKINIDNYSNCV